MITRKEELIALNIINKLERAMFRLNVKPFFRYIIFGMALVFAADLFMPKLALGNWLTLIFPYVMQGQVWRLLTFLVMPTTSYTLLMSIVSMYFYYLVGTSLERSWGARRFLIFYGIGTLANIIAAAITGVGTNMFLNFSLFFALAAIYPEQQFSLFFVLPVKAKWMALFDLALFAYWFVTGNWFIRAAIIASLVNVALFFAKDFIDMFRQDYNRYKRKAAYRKNFR